MFRFFFITAAVFAAQGSEFILFNFFGPWFKPNLLILLVIFFNLAYGIRHSLWTAVCAGILTDSFSAAPFGINIFSFVFSAYMTTVLKQYLYHMGSSAPRFLLILLVILVNIVTHHALALMLVRPGGFYGWGYILWSEILLTLLVFHFVFEFLKRCVSKFCV